MVKKITKRSGRLSEHTSLGRGNGHSPVKTRPSRATSALGLAQGEEEPTAVDELIKKGKEQGYLTQDDVLAAFPEAESNLEQLEELYIVLFDEGIAVVEAEKAPAA